MARIKIKNSQVKDKAPVPSDLVAGELAINTHADSPAIYLKDTAGAVRKIAGAGAIGGTPATETDAGIVELATAAETTAGTDATRAVHPAGLKVELDKKANLASPALTGVPTAPTAAAGTNTTQVATTAFVTDAVAKENLWDRTGTVVSPANAGDQVHTGTGKLTVGGTAAAPNLEVNADGGIVAKNAGFIYDAATKRLGIGVSPGVALDVSAPKAVGRITSSTGTNAVYVNYGNTGGNFYLGLENSAGSDFSVPAYSALMMHGATKPLVFGNANVIRVLIDEQGKLLVGSNPTTAPAVSLDPGTTGSPLVRDSLGRVLVGKATAPTGAPNGSLTAEGGLVLKSPDGKYWNVTVSNAGALSAVAL